jgi:MFS family permease
LTSGDASTAERAAVEPPASWWRQSRYLAFVVSRTISITGDMAAVAAITVHIYAVTGSGVAVGAFFVVRTLPRILAPFAGAIADRLELRRLLVLCDVVCGVVFLAIAAIDPHYSVLLCLMFVAESAATIALPAARTMIGRTVPAGKLTAANGLLLAITSLGFAGGSALGALAAASSNYRWALLGNALSFGVSALLLTRLRRADAEPRPDRGQGLFAETRAGLAVIRANPALPPVIIGLIAVAFAASLDRVALVVIVVQQLHAPTVWYGLTLGAISVGVLAASLCAARWRRVDRGSDVFFRVGIIAQAAGHLTMGVAPVVQVLLLGGVTAGLGNGLETVCGTTLLQRLVDRRLLGTVMGVVLSWSFLANAVGSQIGGSVVDLVGPRWTFVVAAAIMAGCAALVLVRRPRKTVGGDSAYDQTSPHSGARDDRE